MGQTEHEATTGEVLAFETATRDLVGLALRSVEGLDMSLPQFRLLLVLDELGPSSSVTCARALGVVGSSITRLADRLDASGHLLRSPDPANRSITVLTLTDAGRTVVRTVVRRRRSELREALGALDPAARTACAAALATLHEVLDGRTSDDDLRRHIPF